MTASKSAQARLVLHYTLFSPSLPRTQTWAEDAGALVYPQAASGFAAAPAPFVEEARLEVEVAVEVPRAPAATVQHQSGKTMAHGSRRNLRELR